MDLSLITDWRFNLELAIPLMLSLLCGGMIGAERAINGRAAGIRTYALVCFASSMLMAICAHPHLWAGVAGTRGVDAGRLVQGIVTGMGFLGSGVIVRDGVNIKGLTTASALWVVAAIGVLIGSNFYIGAVMATLMTLVVLRASHLLEHFVPKTRYTQVSIEIDPSLIQENEVIEMLSAARCKVTETFYEFAKDTEKSFKFTFTVRTIQKGAERAVAEALATRPGVLRFRLSPARDA
jgi:putative Mg2+ transporter-C (MgtC) family protein